MVYLRMCKTVPRWFSSHIYVDFMEKEPPAKLCGVFDQYLRTYEVTKCWMIRQGLDVSDVISTNDNIYDKEIDILTLVPL